MSLRQKFVTAFAVIAAIVAGTIGTVAYTTTEHALRNEINVSLAAAMTALVAGGSLSDVVTPSGPGPGDHHDGPQAVDESAQKIAADGTVSHLSGLTVPLPVGAEQRELAATSTAGRQSLDQVTVDGTTYQVLTQSLGGGKGAIQVGRDLGSALRVLRDVAEVTLIVGLGVLLLAAAFGWWLARRMTRRLTAITGLAETVSKDGKLDIDFAMPGRDEVGRLSASLQLMVNQLVASQQAQQRLVQNAGHELRTPLTSLRTNVSVLRRFAELPPASQQRLLDDVSGETKELTDLVNELVELSMDQRGSEMAEPVDLCAIAERVAARFEHRYGRSVIVIGQRPTLALGRPKALERAISNLVDNALKFDSTGGPVEVTVSAAAIVVADRGPGLQPADEPRIFDRFYRADAARSLPGSGLGLSIVAEVAAAHGGAGFAHAREGGGAYIGFRLGPETFSPDSNPAEAGD